MKDVHINVVKYGQYEAHFIDLSSETKNTIVDRYQSMYEVSRVRITNFMTKKNPKFVFEDIKGEISMRFHPDHGNLRDEFLKLLGGEA